VRRSGAEPRNPGRVGRAKTIVVLALGGCGGFEACCARTSTSGAESRCRRLRCEALRRRASKPRACGRGGDRCGLGAGRVRGFRGSLRSHLNLRVGEDRRGPGPAGGARALAPRRGPEGQTPTMPWPARAGSLAPGPLRRGACRRCGLALLRASPASLRATARATSAGEGVVRRALPGGCACSVGIGRGARGTAPGGVLLRVARRSAIRPTTPRATVVAVRPAVVPTRRAMVLNVASEVRCSTGAPFVTGVRFPAVKAEGRRRVNGSAPFGVARSGRAPGMPTRRP